MAWQLLYTSAPRSLEAGRSGFGTVARHRAISPLLASAIERTSQFSRLPGSNAGRVIFSYRIVAVAGGRFHVLSSIRDAGADYTGRTNHIAHHLVAEAREVAQLGPSGPSPADVLLAMQWATSWTAPPRYLEAPDEIALAALRPRPATGAWERLTGRPAQAGLLASGDAARGAYIIHAAGHDLREFFAESLRLIPERLWQISLTTSLQPSDEPADFRWIGIEEDSPMRAQTESTGRPVLNLALPESLPVVEVPQAAVARQETSAAASAATSLADRTLPAEPASAVSTGRKVKIQIPRRAPRRTDPIGEFPQRKKRKLAWPGSILAIVLVVAAIYACHPMYLHYEHRKTVAAEIDSLLGKSGGFFSSTVGASLKNADSVDTAKELAEAADRSWQMAYHADFAAMLRLPDASVRDHARSANLNTPEEINSLDDRLVKIAKLHEQLADFPQKPEDFPALDRIEKLWTDAGALTVGTANPNTFDTIKKSFDRLAGRQWAETVRTLLTGASGGRAQPAEPAAWFEKVLAAPKFKPDDDDASQALQASRQILDDWKFIDAQAPGKPLPELEKRLRQQTVWPQWLLAKARSKLAPAGGGKSVSAGTKSDPPPPAPEPPLPRVPLYFVNGKESLPNFRIEELGPKQTFYFQPGFNARTFPLIDLAKDGNLRRSAVAAPDFKVIVAQKTIVPLKGTDNLAQPFLLLAKDSSGAEAFQLWVAAPSGSPLYPKHTAGLVRKGDTLVLSPSSLGLSGTPKNRLFIALPDSCFPEKPLSNLLPLEKWTVDLSSARKQLEGQVVLWKQRIADLTKEAEAPAGDPGAVFGELAAELEGKAGFSDNERKQLAGKSASLRERCGGYVMAVAASPKIEGFDRLFTDGGRLKNLEPKADAAKEAEVFRAVGNSLQIARANLNTLEERKQMGPRLDILAKMLALLQPETPEARTLRQKETDVRKKMIAGLESKLASAHPLLSDNVPPGLYRLVARDGGMNIPLVEIEIIQ